MASKTTLVRLDCGDYSREFRLEKAEWLLSLRGGGWSLPDGSPWEYAGGRLVVKQNNDKKSKNGGKKS